MKNWVLFSAVFSALVGFSSSAAINTASQDVLRMAQSGVSDAVIEGYVNNSAASYNLNADDILYLQQNGVPQPVISAMIAHDNNNLAQGNVPQGQTTYSEQPQPQNYDNNQAPPPDQSVQVNPPNVYGNQGYSDQTVPYSDQSVPVMQVAPNQAPPQVASFYSELQPYGNWIYLESYGWCWQPNEVRTVANWQPYRDNGSWLYCDDGWYWQSQYNWGWAPFHYGRWSHASFGWVWFPDTVWAPSWVYWRSYGDYCGWAPLPPSTFVGYGRPGFHFGVNFDVGLGAGLFTFINFGDIFHGDYRHHEIPHSQVTQIFNRTRVVNNVTVVNNNYARNPGISRRTVQRYTGPIQVANVRTSTADPRVSRPGVVRTGSQVAVVRPQRAPTPEQTTQIVGHRLPANARSVPATPPTRTINSRARTQPNTTTSAQPNQRPQTPSARQTQRNPNQNQNQRAQTPSSTTPRVSEPSGAINPQTPTPTTPSNQRPTGTPHTTGTAQPNNSRVNEVPGTNPRVREVPLTTPRSTEVRQPNETPRPSETPHSSNPHVTEVPHPNANPRVNEVPHPTPSPRVTEVPHVNQTPPAPHVTAPAPHVAVPHETIHEPAGGRGPAVVPHAAAPAPHVSAPPPHVSAPHPSPPAHVSAPPPEVHAAPAAHPPALPPGQERKQDH